MDGSFIEVHSGGNYLTNLNVPISVGDIHVRVIYSDGKLATMYDKVIL